MCSESERWRAQAAIQLTLGAITGSKVAVLDRGDLLDASNRAGLVKAVNRVVGKTGHGGTAVQHRGSCCGHPMVAGSNQERKDSMTDILQITDPGCCGVRRVDEDGCCMTCGRDFFDPATGAEVGDGSRVANPRLRAAAPDLFDMAEEVLAYQDHLPANVVRDIKAVIAKAKGEA